MNANNVLSKKRCSGMIRRTLVAITKTARRSSNQPNGSSLIVHSQITNVEAKHERIVSTSKKTIFNKGLK